MSTQRRENDWQPRNGANYAKKSEPARLAPVAQHGRAYAKVGTAPPKTTDSLLKAWLATNSLQLDHRISQLVWLIRLVRHVLQDFRPGSQSLPPFGAGRRVSFDTPATLRSSLPHIPVPSGFARPSPTLPQNPAGKCRWTERYDGKRDLYFQHAA